MARTVRERVSAHRERLKAQGMVSLHLVVPASDAPFFRDLSARARSGETRTTEEADTALPSSPTPPRSSTTAGAREPTLPKLTRNQQRLAERWAVHSGLKLRLSGSGLKLAEILARNISHEIALAGWPVGRNLGTEQALQVRYGVSRGILREAIRLLESQSLARMKRGAGGGLVVVMPTASRATYACGNFLEARHYAMSDLCRTRAALEAHVLERCADRLDSQAREQLKAHLLFESTLTSAASGADLQRFHRLLASLCGDTALELFIDVVLRMARFHGRYDNLPPARREDIVEQARSAHADITRALFENDVQRAIRSMRRYISATERWGSAV